MGAHVVGPRLWWRDVVNGLVVGAIERPHRAFVAQERVARITPILAGAKSVASTRGKVGRGQALRRRAAHQVERVFGIGGGAGGTRCWFFAEQAPGGEHQTAAGTAAAAGACRLALLVQIGLFVAQE